MSTPGRPAFPSGWRGYARADVDAHVEQTAAELEHARRQLQRLRGERDAAREQVRQLEQAERTAADRTVQQGDHPDPHPGPAAPGPADPLPTDRLETASARAWSSTPLPHPRPPGPRRRSRRWTRLVPLLLLVALVPAGAWWLSTRDDDGPGTDRVAATTPSRAAAAPSSAPPPVASPAPSPAPAPTAAAAPLPSGWTTHRGRDGAWTIGLPPGWRAVGGDEEQGFVSASGLTRMWVRTTEVGAGAAAADLEQFERGFATEHPGYRRRAVTPGEHRGSTAVTWEYEHGAGAGRQRGEDLGVLVGPRAHWLHVESRASAWRFAVPLVEGFRETFVPA